MNTVMRKALVVACFLATGVGSVKAEPAILRNGELHISEGIVIDTNGDRYFKNVKLHTMPDGSLKIVSAQPRNLVQLDELEVNVIYGSPAEVEVLVRGHKSVACVDLEPIAIRRVNYTFHVLIAQTPLDPLALCAQAAAPVELTVDLDVAGLPAGEYEVRVNNEPMEFTLDEMGI